MPLRKKKNLFLEKLNSIGLKWYADLKVIDYLNTFENGDFITLEDKFGTYIGIFDKKIKGYNGVDNDNYISYCYHAYIDYDYERHLMSEYLLTPEHMCISKMKARYSTEGEKEFILEAIRKENLEWDYHQKIIKEIPLKGNLCIFWDDNNEKDAIVEIMESRIEENNEIYYKARNYNKNFLNCVKFRSEKQFMEIINKHKLFNNYNNESIN